jgi:TldD protein
MTTRRAFLKTGATAATLAAVASAPRPLLAQLGRRSPEPVPPPDDPRLKELATRAIEAARSAGAVYADARLTHVCQRELTIGTIMESELLTVGVRALVSGYWGFASGPVWSPDEMARLGREACHQAKANTLGKVRTVDLAPVTLVSDGHWMTPVKIDPFEVSPFEVNDFLRSLEIFVEQSLRNSIRGNSCQFYKQNKVFASTAGSYFSQRTYRTAGTFVMQVVTDDRKKDDQAMLDCLSPAGVGWEMYRDQPLREKLRQLSEEVKADLALPMKPVDVGRYDTILDAASVINLLSGTLGAATELDRALGYEANAGGTSYINDPFGMIGTYQMGAPSLTVTGNRSEPGGAATVKWDDEGVAPDEFTLVKDGVLVDFQTTRESAGWLKDYYGKTGKPFRSHGCAAAPSAINAPLQHSSNITLVPGRDALDFDALISGVTKGIAVKGATLDMDFQHSSGLGLGRTFEIKNGKRVAMINSAGLLFRATELWKGLLAVGGSASLRRFGLLTTKGEPEQEHYASVTAPPALFKQVTLIDPLRKA